MTDSKISLLESEDSSGNGRITPQYFPRVNSPEKTGNLSSGDDKVDPDTLSTVSFPQGTEISLQKDISRYNSQNFQHTDIDTEDEKLPISNVKTLTPTPLKAGLLSNIECLFNGIILKSENLQNCWDSLISTKISSRQIVISILTNLLLISIAIPLSLDGYFSKLVPDFLIGFLFATYLIVIYNNYVNVNLKQKTSSFITEYLQVDITNPQKRKSFFLFTFAVSATPGFVLCHGYSTTNAPAFFPTSLFSIMMILITGLISLRKPFLEKHILFSLSL